MHKLIRTILIMTMALPIQFGMNSELFALNTTTNRSTESPDKKSRLAKFRQEYQLLFVYTSKCPYCHRFAKILHDFSKRNNIHVASLTDDGGKIEPFNNARHDKNRISELGVDGFPVLFVEHKKNQKTKLIADGLVTYKELEQAVNGLLDQLYES